MKFIKTREAAEILGVNESMFRVWVLKKLVLAIRTVTCDALFDRKKLRERWQAVENIPDTQELSLGRKAEAFPDLRRKAQEIELAKWRQQRREARRVKTTKLTNSRFMTNQPH